jgi:carbon-monoxide dehydrogenase medium subunit
MKMPKFDYVCPASLDEAIRLLATHEGAKILSGGQSLLPLLAFRLTAPSMLVDIQKIDDLDRIELTPEGLRVGSRVRWCQIEQDPRLADSHPLFQAMISHVAHYQIRNRGTVGGSLAHADPAAEMPGVAVICDCEIVVVGSAGRRIIKAAEFFAGALETTLENDEVIVEVRFPPWPASRRWAFQEFARRRGDFAIAGVAVFFDQDAEGRIENAHLGVIGAASVPIRLPTVEHLIEGRHLDDALIEQARQAAADAVDPGADIHAGADYRKALVGTLTARVLRAALPQQRNPS